MFFCKNSYEINFYDKKHEDENFVETEINLKWFICLKFLFRIILMSEGCKKGKY